jgi:hypothetical protein
MQPTFRRNISPPSSGSKKKFQQEPASKQVASRINCDPENPEDGGDMFLRNVGCISTDYTASHPRRWYSSQPPLWKLQILHRFILVFLRPAKQITATTLIRPRPFPSIFFQFIIQHTSHHSTLYNLRYWTRKTTPTAKTQRCQTDKVGAYGKYIYGRYLRWALLTLDSSQSLSCWTTMAKEDDVG